MAFTLAHVSDLHLPVPPGALRPLGQLAGKRLLAYLAWRRKRRRAAAPGALLADIAAGEPDHIAVTGDLTNLALPGEFAAARELLAGLSPPGGLSLVPGNHDATVAVPWAEGLGRWDDWMAGEGAGPGAFPFLHRRGPLALIGLSSALPTLPGSAAGELGGDQLARLPALLDRAAREGLFRVVLIHHPPLPGPGGRRKALRDGAALREILARDGAELVLHGHHHRVMQGELPGPAGPIPVLGAPHALAPGHGWAGWWLHRIERDAGAWRLESVLRLQDPATGRFAEGARPGAWRLARPATEGLGHPGSGTA